ncbi:MAG TPA: major capsid protein [Allocoleopsis sp.]
MGYIANWLSEEQQAAEAQLTIDDTLLNLMQRGNLLDEFMKIQMYNDRDFVLYITERLQTVASLIAYGAEPPTTQAGRLQKVRGQLFKSGLAFDYPEEMQWRMRDAMQIASMRGIAVQTMQTATGEIVRGSNQDLASFIFKTIADMTIAQFNLLNALTWQALQYGEVSWTDPRTNTTQVLDYKDGTATYNHFPADKTGNDAWTAYATANGLNDLEEDVETFIDTNGRPPKAIAMSRKLRRHLLNQESTRQSVASITSTLANTTVNVVGSLGLAQLDAIIERRELPPIVTFDEMYQIEATNKTITKARFLNTDRYVFLTEDMGERAMGPTLESDGQEGIYVVTREIRNFPPQDATQGVATLMPVVPNPKLLFSRKVA